ncbi:MAG: hydrogen peroxide-dependent heme synthase [Gemmatimonadota bacterium]
MRDTPAAPATLEGWYLLHQLFRLDWPRVKTVPPETAARMGEEFSALFSGPREEAKDGWSGAYRLVGGGADFLLMHFREDLEALVRAERRIQASELGDYLQLTADYLSVVELGLYSVSTDVAERLAREGRAEDPEAWAAELGKALEEQREIPYVQRRLRPVQPEGMPYVSFYPMNKRREAGRNWYTLPLEERAELMHDHGSVGRRYAGRISQVISGSVGLDDWEWAVTLFGEDPLAFKEVVTEMRYDRASAEYAEFGDFYVGVRMRPDEWKDPEAW